LRDGFEIKYPIRASKNIDLPSNSKFYAGDYLNFNSLEIIEPRSLLNCLLRKCNYSSDTMLLVSKQDDSIWNLYLEKDNNFKCKEEELIKKVIQECETTTSFKEYLSKNKIRIHKIADNLVDFEVERSEMLQKVREGKIPKGVLKKWPLYIVKSNTH
jgi:hypothetical protein